MSWVTQRFRDISPVTLQVVGGAMSSSLYCGDMDGLSLLESFMVELYRCKACQFTCGLKTTISNHLLQRHATATLTCCPEEGLGAGLQQEGMEAGLHQQGPSYQLDLNGESKQSEEDEDFLLYNMLGDMTPPTCDITTEGALQVAHTCEVNTLFEEEEEEEEEEDSSMLPLKGAAVDLSCPINPPSTQEEIEQSAHLMTLGLCRITAVKPPSPTEPSSLQRSVSDVKTEAPPPAAPPPDPQQLLCFLCPLILPSRQLLDVHVRSHQAGSGFICSRCSWTSNSWEELELHWRSHGRKRRSRRSREEQLEENHHRTNMQSSTGGACSKSSNTWRSSLIGQEESKKVELTERSLPSKTRTHQISSTQHLSGTKMSRTKKPEYKSSHQTGLCCSICHIKFSSKLTLRRHLGVHGGERPYTCPHCTYSSRLKASLLQHLRTHTGEKPYRCSECSYASIDRSSLLRHCRTHSQEKPYRCHLCTYSSIQKKSLDLHTRRHHTGEAFLCQQCDYSSPDRQMLVKHIHKYHVNPE